MLFLLNMGILNAQQKIKVTGQIVDNNQEAIIGANVLIKGTTIGTITDFNGNFTLDANIGSVLNELIWDMFRKRSLSLHSSLWLLL